MASHERESSLLFPDHDVVVLSEGLRACESVSVSCGSSYSSWSDLSSPFGSELESTSETTESEDEEFISELTRQMAESMLQEDEDDSEAASESLANWSDGSKPGSVCYYYNSEGFMGKSENSTSESAPNVRNLNPDENSTDEQLRPVQVYELKNQPQLIKQQGKRVKATDSTHHQPPLQKEKQSPQNRGGGKAWKQGHGKKNGVPLFPAPPAGSGMRAVFLGGSERNGSTGTGVFLPTAAYTKPEPKRKPGCSTVLIPARVLQTLQQHFNTVGTPSPSTTSGGSANLPWRNDVLARINVLLQQKRDHAEFQTQPESQSQTAYSPTETGHHPEAPQLPQEWTY